MAAHGRGLISFCLPFAPRDADAETSEPSEGEVNNVSRQVAGRARECERPPRVRASAGGALLHTWMAAPHRSVPRTPPLSVRVQCTLLCCFVCPLIFFPFPHRGYICPARREDGGLLPQFLFLVAGRVPLTPVRPRQAFCKSHCGRLLVALYIDCCT